MKNLKDLKTSFIQKFHKEPSCYIDTGGRFEIVGNHTDHNHGLCLVANCSLRIKAYVAKEIDGVVKIKSEGFSFFKFDVNDLEEGNEKSKTRALCKGILFKLKEMGYKVGAFSAYITSEIPDGSGVSSSAAIESLIGYIQSYLYNDGKIPAITIAKVGQFSENNYFHKPSGLLDQVGTSFPSCNFLDFKNISDPIVTNIKFNLPLTLFLVKSLGDHANLTPLYAAIPHSMNHVASLLENKNFLRDVNDENIFERIDKLDVNDEEKRKAKHFFYENNTVLEAKKALENDDTEQFLKAVKASQESSKHNLENTFVKGEYEGSPQAIMDELNNVILDHGAIRIHGGGFKGTVLAFIKNDFADEFEAYLKKHYSNCYYRVSISSSAVNFEEL